jgi:hypothetical protein
MAHQDDATISAPSPVPTLIRMRQSLAQPIFAAFLAGGVAGAVSRTVVSPLERLKILFQIQSVGREEYKLSVGKGLMKMWREEGWRGFMRGNGTNCVRIVPYSAVQFGSYNFYKRVSPSLFQISTSSSVLHDGFDSSMLFFHVYFLFCTRNAKRINADAYKSLVCRSIPWGGLISLAAVTLRWSCWYYLCGVHLST